MLFFSPVVSSDDRAPVSSVKTTYSPSPNPLGPKSHPNFNSDHCHHINAGTLSILYFNALSLIPKFDELCLLVETHQPDIVCIVEIWLDHNISDNEIHLPGFQLYWLDRNRHGSGILCYPHNFSTMYLTTWNFNHFCMLDTINFEVWITLFFYKPPGASSHILDTLFGIMKNLNIAQFCNLVILTLILMILHTICSYSKLLTFRFPAF